MSGFGGCHGKVLTGGVWVGDDRRGREGLRYAVEESANFKMVCFNLQKVWEKLKSIIPG